MRTTTVQGKTLKYPDAVTFAFNPVLFIAESVEYMTVAVTYGGVTYTQTYEAYQGNVYGDLQQIVQLFYADEQFALDYTLAKQSTSLGKTITYDVTIQAGQNTGTFSGSSFIIWGAVNPNGKDVFNTFRKQKYFAGYPFTFGFYTQGGTSTILIGNGASPRTYVTINAQGMWELNGNQLPSTATFSNIYDYAGTLQQGYFDNTFDLTFYMWQNVAQTLLGRIDIEPCPDEDTVYLRWISRHGFYSYWLFNYKQRQRQTQFAQDFARTELQAYDLDFGYERGAGRRVAYTRNGVIPLAVPLADVEQYDYLLDVISSPCVDMYIGKDTNNVPRWQTVAVQAGTFTQTDKEMQDFVINIILPSIPVQRL